MQMKCSVHVTGCLYLLNTCNYFPFVSIIVGFTQWRCGLNGLYCFTESCFEPGSSDSSAHRQWIYAQERESVSGGSTQEVRNSSQRYFCTNLKIEKKSFRWLWMSSSSFHLTSVSISGSLTQEGFLKEFYWKINARNLLMCTWKKFSLKC